MAVKLYNSEITVLLLYNLDPEWSRQEQEEVQNLSLYFSRAISSIGFGVTLVPLTHCDLDSILSPYDPQEYIVFNWCESLPGVPHSEWLVADYLTKHGYTFTGADAGSLALSEDKTRVKRLWDKAGIPTPSWQTFDSTSRIMWDRFPAIVKGAKAHCSEGINRESVVMSEIELKNRIRHVIEKYRQPALVEDFIDGRELHVSLWGNGKLSMLPPTEMEFSMFHDRQDRICTYDSKFVPDSYHYRNIKTVLPAPLSVDELNAVEDVCKSAFKLTGCRDYGRIDLRLRDGIWYVLDVNPNSDISPDTSTICAAELVGYNYGEFIGCLINLAAERHPLWKTQRHTYLQTNTQK